MNRNIPFRPTHVLRFGNWACSVHVERDGGDRRRRPLNGPCYQRHEWDDGKIAEWHWRTACSNAMVKFSVQSSPGS